MQPAEIRKQQRETWNRFSKGWKKWDELTMNFLRPPGTAMLDAIPWKDDFSVLDIACGTGEPGLTAAAIVKSGRVTGTDLSEEMVAIAKENAGRKNLTNYTTRVCSADELPFEDAAFDVVLCRMGFMFFPDIPKAASEMARVLKPGGYFATSVWSTGEKNPWITTIMGVMKRYVDVPKPEPDSPYMFRCAEPGFMSNVLRKAGFSEIAEKKTNFSMDLDGPEWYWTFQSEVAAPVVAAIANSDAATIEKIKNETIEEAAKFKKNGKISMPAEAIIATAKK